jgi:hypothetical protein
VSTQIKVSAQMKGAASRAAQRYERQTQHSTWLDRRQRRWRDNHIFQGKVEVLLGLLHDPRTTPSERTTVLECLGGIVLEAVVGGYPW